MSSLSILINSFINKSGGTEVFLRVWANAVWFSCCIRVHSDPDILLSIIIQTMIYMTVIDSKISQWMRCSSSSLQNRWEFCSLKVLHRSADGEDFTLLYYRNKLSFSDLLSWDSSLHLIICSKWSAAAFGVQSGKVPTQGAHWAQE